MTVTDNFMRALSSLLIHTYVYVSVAAVFCLPEEPWTARLTDSASVYVMADKYIDARLRVRVACRL